MRASLVLHGGVRSARPARSALQRAVLGVLLLEGGRVLEHVEHAIVLIPGRGRGLLLLIAAGVGLVLGLGRRGVRAAVLLVLVLIFILILLVVVLAAVLVFAGVGLSGIGLLPRVPGAAVVRAVGLGVWGLGVLLFVLDAPECDRAIVGSVATDGVASVSG